MTYTLPPSHSSSFYINEKSSKSESKKFFSPQIKTSLKKSILNQNRSHYTTFQYVQKRAVDFIFSVMLLTFMLPIVLYTIYRIKKESPGPIFFKQSRVGLNGKTFTCYKFRSMYHNSDFNPYTQKCDSRIFPFGKIMRKMRIDEIPQLFNILKGEMHLIGPRAEWDILVEKYERIIPDYHARHTVAPGITGLAQVLYPYGCNTQDAKNKLRYDKLYIQSWSLKLELQIVWNTINVILKRKGQ